MRPVDHLAVDAETPRGIGREGLDDGARGAAHREGVKASLITGTCAGWIASLATKPSRRASRHSRASPQIAEVREHGVDGVDLGGSGSKEREVRASA